MPPTPGHIPLYRYSLDTQIWAVQNEVAILNEQITFWTDYATPLTKPGPCTAVDQLVSGLLAERARKLNFLEYLRVYQNNE